jgi:hypothetical protein
MVITITIFLILSAVIKLRWTFEGHPMEHDIALCNYVVSHYGSSPNRVLYSHVLFSFFTKRIFFHASLHG